MNEWWRWHDPKEMAQVYRRSKIVVNISRDDYPQDANMRVFEAMAGGALLITGLPTELTELGFQEGKHFVGYHDEREIEDLVRYYLEHPQERLCIAEAARDLVLKEHTYDRRAETIIETVQQHNGEFFAPARQWDNEKVGLTYLRYYCSCCLLDCAFEELAQLRRLGYRAAMKGFPLVLRAFAVRLKASL